MKSAEIHWYRLILILIVVVILFAIGWYRIEIDSDIVASLPEGDPVISDAVYIFKNHPVQDQLFIDVGLQADNLEILLACGDQVEKKLNNSGLFKNVGLNDVQHLIPDLMAYIVKNLPVMFTAKELDNKIKPLLESNEVNKRLQAIYSQLLEMGGIGQAEFISKDPLGLKDLILARLSHLAPSQNARIYRGNLISADGRHLLVIANPIASGTDTTFARRAAELIDNLADELNRKYAEAGYDITLTPTGAYRAALDNELIIRRDVKTAILLATIGIAVLLIFAFPRPLMGLLSLLPALAGSMIAFFIFSLLHKSISIMVLGFGGAIISITVDHGIAYFLFLDRPYKTSGREASTEVWAVGLLAALTTVGAFGVLTISGFPVFEQLGLFTALGIAFSFLFVHSVFPKVFTAVSPARPRRLPLENVVGALAQTGKKGAYAALGFAIVMLFFAKPEFNVSLSAMNTVSNESLAAENLFAEVWGDIFSKIYLMSEGQSVTELQKKGDSLLKMMDPDLVSGVLSTGFVPSMVFPGKDRRLDNFADWKKFWNQSRVSRFKHAMAAASMETGFTVNAFKPFYKLIDPDLRPPLDTAIPEKFYSLMGITENSDGTGWVQFSGLTPGKSYQAERFFERYQSAGKLFDPTFFSQKLGRLLFSTFTKMLVIIGISVTILLFLFFLDWKLTVISLLPVIFALISTLGTLNLIGHPLDIPALMLAIVVMGMGIDYSLFFVRSYQRYPDASHPSYRLIRMAVFMASASTLIGFGALCTAEHSILRSAGLTSLFGIGYSLIGAFIILPLILKYVFQSRQKEISQVDHLHDRILRRYLNMEAYPRLFARLKIRLDPMFSELSRIFEFSRQLRTIIDIGCGFGVPASWLVENFAESKIYGIDLDSNRVRIASRALGQRGVMVVGRAPDVPRMPHPADAAVMLDMLHYLKDDDLGLTLRRLADRLRDNGRLIIRTVIMPNARQSLFWWLENLKNKMKRIPAYYRSLDEISTILAQTDFIVEHTEPSGSKGDLYWFILNRRVRNH
jgi:predicted exporter/trans-aconitate methyltransferase